MDNAAMKENQHKAWSNVAAGWKKHDAWMTELTKGVTAKMVAGLKPGQRVLDIACGTGEPSLSAAERVGPSGHVLATDFVEEMVSYAREKAERRGLKNMEFRRMDGEALDIGPAKFHA